MIILNWVKSQINHNNWALLIIVAIASFIIWSNYVQPIIGYGWEVITTILNQQGELQVNYAKLEEEVRIMRNDIAKQKVGRKLGEEFELVIRQ